MSCVVTRQDHKLKFIASYMDYRIMGASRVIRWCEDCGAVVVDLDCDGRTHPGDVMEMKFPVLAKREEARIDRDAILGVKS
jgi:valyl-tRNA synthetase